jgi:glutathione S-transferase
MIELYELAGADPDIRFSPYCWRIRMALAHKGLEAEITPWHFTEPTLPEGADEVPVLVDNGTVITDSTAIARHLEAKYANGPSLFGGEAGEAHANFITAWTDSVLHPSVRPLVTPDVLAQVKPEARDYFRATRERLLGTTLEQAAAAREEHLAALSAALDPLRVTLRNAPFLGGEEPTYADYTVFGAFMWVRCGSGCEVLASNDPVYDWRERMLDLFDGLARDAATAEG